MDDRQVIAFGRRRRLSGREAPFVARQLKMLADRLTLYGALTLLGLYCFTWTLLSIPLFVLLPRGLGTALGRFTITTVFHLYGRLLAAVGAYRLDLRAMEALRTGPAVVLAPNHPSLIDALLLLGEHPNLTCVMKTELMRNVFLGGGARLARYIGNDPPRKMILEAVASLKRGAVLMLFPEGTRTTRAPVNELKGSIAVIAKRARVPVQTLIIETDSAYLSKGWALFRPPVLPITYRVRLGRRFDPPTDVAAFMEELERYFRAELANSLQTKWLGHGGDLRPPAA
jgi:1-acyl-sn-glycerol-3-phosphate acyltransferase